MILGRDEDASGRNQCHNLAVRLSPEIVDALNVLSNIGHLQVGIKCRNAVMEGLSVVLQFTAKISHPIDVEFAVCHVKGSWVVALAQGLALDQAVKDAVHWNLGFKLLTARSHAINEIMAQGSALVACAHSLLNCSVVLQGSTSRACAKLSTVLVAQEEGLSVRALVTLEGDSDAFYSLCRVPAIFLFISSESHTDEFLFSGLLW